jgi:hypothetical protein
MVTVLGIYSDEFVRPNLIASLDSTNLKEFIELCQTKNRIEIEIKLSENIIDDARELRA